MNIHRMTPEQILSRVESQEVGCAGCDHHRPLGRHGHGFGCRIGLRGWPDATNKEIIRDEQGREWPNPDYCIGWKKRRRLSSVTIDKDGWRVAKGGKR